MHHWNYHSAQQIWVGRPGFCLGWLWWLLGSCSYSHFPWMPCESRCCFGWSLAYSKSLEAALWSISQGGQAACFVVAWAEMAILWGCFKRKANVRRPPNVQVILGTWGIQLQKRKVYKFIYCFYTCLRSNAMTRVWGGWTPTDFRGI